MNERILPMIAIRRLAVATVLGCAAVAGSGQFAPLAAADPNAMSFSIAFNYDAGKSAEVNYGNFLRQARRACEGPGNRPLDARQREAACVDDIVDAFVRKLGRLDIAAIHFDRTGRLIDSSRMFAAR